MVFVLVNDGAMEPAFEGAPGALFFPPRCFLVIAVLTEGDP
jgi:hypothetical protein